ncbi:hypothetical protein ABVT39_006069 [Epinephelus coioides]
MQTSRSRGRRLALGDPGPTDQARRGARDVASTFRLFVTAELEALILDHTNWEGVRRRGDEWREMDSVDLRAYMGLLILAGVYRSNPGPKVTVDEQLVPFRGQCPFRQYMPSKPAKYGIKSWVACDARSSYAWKMQVYTGKPQGGRPEKNQGTWVVLDLTRGLSRRNVTCDNFFTSYDLGQRLLRRGLTMVGTVRKNKPELPPALLATRERAVLSCRFNFKHTAGLLIRYAAKNKQCSLSTMNRQDDVSKWKAMAKALNQGALDHCGMFETTEDVIQHLTSYQNPLNTEQDAHSDGGSRTHRDFYYHAAHLPGPIRLSRFFGPEEVDTCVLCRYICVSLELDRFKFKYNMSSVTIQHLAVMHSPYFMMLFLDLVRIKRYGVHNARNNDYQLHICKAYGGQDCTFFFPGGRR